MVYPERSLRWLGPAGTGLFSVVAALVPANALATSGVTFNEIAGPSTSIVWERAPSLRYSAVVQAHNDSLIAPITSAEVVNLPVQSHGLPGITLFDYDLDGDLDIYVTNGPGAPHSLLSNQLIETGQLTFIDLTAAAGVAAIAQDSSGTCFADIDNDGDDDLFVIGYTSQLRVFGGTWLLDRLAAVHMT